MEYIFQNQYSCSELKANIYQFSTHHSVTYTAYFANNSGYFPGNILLEENVYVFGFEVEKRPKKFDPLIEPTIIDLIRKFFINKPKAALLFVCDGGENLGRNRKITFNKWYRRNESGIFEKHDFVIHAEDNDYFASLIIYSGNEQKKVIIDSCNELVEDISK